MYPDQIVRNYFPILMFLIPLGIYFIVKMLPYYHVFLAIVCGFLFFQIPDMKSYKGYLGYLKTDILNTKAFISYFDKNYGDKFRSPDSKVFSIWPEQVLLSVPNYEYVQRPIVSVAKCQLSQIEEYKAAIFKRGEKTCLIFYTLLLASSSFISVETPFKNYEVFFHKDLLY